MMNNNLYAEVNACEVQQAMQSLITRIAEEVLVLEREIRVGDSLFKSLPPEDVIAIRSMAAAALLKHREKINKRSKQLPNNPDGMAHSHSIGGLLSLRVIRNVPVFKNRPNLAPHRIVRGQRVWNVAYEELFE